MNKKGAMTPLGMLIVVAITVIVGAVLFQVTAQEAGSVRNTYAIVNDSIVATNNTAIYLPYKAISNPVIWNNTADTVILAGNYTITNGVVNDGAVTVMVQINFSSAVYAGDDWNISGTVQPTTYGDGAARAMTNLIILFFALAIATVALYPFASNGLKNLVTGN